MPDTSISPVLSNFPTNNPKKSRTGRLNLVAACLLVAAMVVPASAQTAGTYSVANLVSDGSVAATTTDASFINPWGVTNSPTFWINTQATGFSYVVPPATGTISFKVTIPAATGGTTATGTPTGAVATGTATGYVLPNGTKASFLFSSLDGIITGWNNKLGTAGAVGQIAINNNTAGAVYTDMALMTNANGSYLLAANFGKTPAVEVYDSNFAVAKLAGSFSDPSLPANYYPYSVHALGTQVFVTYALRSTTANGEVVGPGNGIVSVFDTSGNFVSRAVTGGNLNAPWGVAVAPTTFGVFGGALLVGNFGDGIINAYDPKTFAYLGQLADGTGKTLVYASLWELVFGNASPNTNNLYFSAGLTGEKHGLFGVITTNPTAAGAATYGFSSSASVATVAAGSSATVIVSAIPTNNFSGAVTLACSGLPVASACTFSPTQLNVTAGAPATSTVTITTVKSTAQFPTASLRGASTAALAAALFLPFGAILTFVRRRSLNEQRSLRLLGLVGVLAIATGFIAGCSSSSNTVTPFTPTGTSAITIKATSGTITQSTIVNLTVQ